MGFFASNHIDRQRDIERESEMVAGRGIAQETMQGGVQTAESPRNWSFGLSLKQTVVIAMVTYAVITAFSVSEHFRNPVEKMTVHRRDKLILNVHGDKSNALAGEETGSTGESNSPNFSHKFGKESGTKDDDQYFELRKSLYHSPVVFGLNYEEMVSQFKVFVYPTDPFSFRALSGETETDEDVQTDDLFVFQLYQSDFVTTNAETAHLFLLPLSLRSVAEDERIGQSRTGKFLKMYVQFIRDDYPYWGRTLGADHVIILCTESAEESSRNVLELRKNSIQVACSPLLDSQPFYPHKDVAMPVHHRTIRPEASTSGERSLLAYYKGPTKAGSLYASFKVYWHRDPSFAFESVNVTSAVNVRMLSGSKFCLILGPQDYGNLVHALRFGCVPVLVSDGRLYDLPFQDVLNWSQFVLIMKRNDVKKLKEFLMDFDPQRYTAMQYLGREACKHLEWHTPPQHQDAFHMVLYDLWLRRHAIRYVKRRDHS